MPDPVHIEDSSLLIVGAPAGKGSGDPKVMSQPPLTSHPEPSWLFAAIADAITTIRRADISPRPGTHCRNCSFTAICPTKDAAREVPS